MRPKSVRTDIHRPGAIVPSNYVYLMSYALPGSEPWDHYNVEEARATCQQYGNPNNGRMHGTMGKCGICGARFRYGDIWMHEPTEHIIHVGHDCAAKYEMLANREGFDTALEMLKTRRAAFIEGQRRKAACEAFIEANPGFKENLDTDHYIIRDIKNRFEQYGSVSEKQVELVAKIAREEREKAARPAEVNVPAPIGRMVIRGILVSRKAHETVYGVTTKATIKVTTPEGVWLAWARCRIRSSERTARKSATKSN